VTNNGVPHQFEEYDGTYMSKIANPLEVTAFRFFSRSMTMIIFPNRRLLPE
jgi:hypothetical protein